MGERGSETPQPLIADPGSPVPRNPENPTNYAASFLLRSLLIAIFIALLPLFPPEFISARSWELLHLLLVGIAVSYGVFSRRNLEMEKETFPSKPDNVHSYVSKLLQGSVFDEEMETQSGYNGGKFQTWNHLYSRREDVVIISEERDLNDGEKPLSLPVRSLKSRVPDAEMEVSGDDNGGGLGSSAFVEGSGSNGSGEMGEIGEMGAIPWRSRSERMEVKEAFLGSSSSPPEFNWFEIESGGNSTSVASPKEEDPSPVSSPEKLSSAASLSPELGGCQGEDESMEIPPPPTRRRSPSYAVNSFLVHSRRSPKEEVKDLDLDTGEKTSSGGSGSQSFRLDMKGSSSHGGPSIGRSNSWASRDGDGDESHKTRRLSEASLPGKSGSSPRNGKSVRTLRRKNGSRANEVEAPLVEKTVRPPPKYPEKEKTEKAAMDSGEDSKTENLNCRNQEVASEGHEVDKKADEFIAKFREQIRLQRTESIKR